MRECIKRPDRGLVLFEALAVMAILTKPAGVLNRRPATTT
jgi:hypothetical protein